MITIKKLRVYLDNCCFNRPYDDQNQLRIELETKAKLMIQQLIVSGDLELIISYISIMENTDNPFSVRKSAIGDFYKYASETIVESNEIIHLANNIISSGIKPKDALHVASAIIAKCDYFFTTDDRILKFNDNRIKIANPVDFAIERGGERHE